MHTRKLGQYGPPLSVIGLGAWAIGGAWRWGWGPSDDQESVRTIHRALDLGINWIDTAAVYGLGHSERIVGQAVKGRRDRVFIATKCGLVWDDHGKVWNDISPQSIRRELEASLQRLETDYIDLYQIHWPHANQSETRAWQELARMKKAGKVRYIGVSNFNVPLLKKCQSISPIDSVQPPYNLLQREAEADILPFCQDNNIGVIAYSPMRSGLLSGRFDRSRLHASDWRSKSPMFNEPLLSQNLNFVETLRHIANDYGKTVGQLAVAWVLKHPAVTSAIVGARTVSQVEENVVAEAWFLDDSILKRIEQALAPS